MRGGRHGAGKLPQRPPTEARHQGRTIEFPIPRLGSARTTWSGYWSGIARAEPVAAIVVVPVRWGADTAGGAAGPI